MNRQKSVDDGEEEDKETHRILHKNEKEKGSSIESQGTKDEPVFMKVEKTPDNFDKKSSVTHDVRSRK